MGEPTTAVRLKALNVPGWGSPIEIPLDGLIIGREQTNDVVVASVDFPHVSSRHARISVVTDGYVVTDLDSKNGTLVDGRSVQDHRLRPGEVIQLGYRGPKFLVLSEDMSGDELEPTMLETADVLPSKDGLRRDADTIVRVKKALGLPEGANVDDVLRARTRRHVVIGSVLALVLVAVTYSIAVNRVDPNLAKVQKEIEDELNVFKREVEEYKAQLARNADQVRGNIKELIARQQALETDGSASADERRVIAEDLRREQERLDDLERLRSDTAASTEATPEIRQVRPAVVLVHLSVKHKQLGTGRYLYRDAKGVYNFDRRGEEVNVESVGTGFCISSKGVILTNAHVIEVEPIDLSIHGWETEIEPDYRVSFVDGGSKSYSAHPGKSNSGADVATLRIKPFAGMPVVPDFSTSEPLPPDGAQLFVIGFPFKSFQVTRGTVTKWDEYLKLDCGISPGSSGSPVVNERGRVVGIAKGRVEDDEGKPLEGMGVVIPVSQAAKVWAPRD